MTWRCNRCLRVNYNPDRDTCKGCGAERGVTGPGHTDDTTDA